MVEEKRPEDIEDEVGLLINRGHFQECDRLLRSLELERLSNEELLSYLEATASVKGVLSYRPEFYTKAKKVLEGRGVEGSLLEKLR